MTVPVQMSDEELLEFVAEFREGILDDEPSWFMCFAVCAPLSTLLRLHGVENRLVEGNWGGGNHFWLQLGDGRVLDPTADQFNGEIGNFPVVYLGPPHAVIHALALTDPA